jgi:AcrR family transcriptional regulator
VTRDTYHHGDLRNALLEAAVELLGEHGAESFTLREAARRVGVNHRAVYRHFEDKTALLAAVAEQGYRELVAQMRAAQAKAAPELERELHALALAYVKFALAQPAHFRVMTGPRLNEDGRFPELERAVQDGYALMVALIERAKTEGNYQGRIEHGVVALWSAVYGIAMLTLQRRVPIELRDVDKFTRRVIAPTIRGLLG